MEGKRNPGLREHSGITVLDARTIYELDKNLRDTFNTLIVRSIPTNQYNRGILKGYFNIVFFDPFETEWSNDKALIWELQYNKGVQVRIEPARISRLQRSDGLSGPNCLD